MTSIMSNHNWLPDLDLRSDLSKSEVHTELLLHNFPFNTSASKLNTDDVKMEKQSPSHIQPDTNLSVSLEISIPYYNLTNYSASFDTADLLHNRSDETHITNGSPQRPPMSPTFANTSHISPIMQANSNIQVATADQVPQRFSKFIVDQNDFTTDSRPATSMARHSRDISDLMGSQATIFSTRLDDSGPSMRSRLKSRSKRSKVFPGSSSVHSLTRQNAIRSKEGILAYRIKIRMKKILSKIKAKLSPIFHIVSKSKKASSSVRMPQRKKSRKGWTRNSRSRPGVRVAPLEISAPVTNPDLGKGLINVGHNLQINHNHLSLDPGRSENDNKWSHMLRFLTEQRRLASPSQAAFLVESVAPPPPPHGKSLVGPKHYLSSQLEEAQKESQAVQMLWRNYLAGILAQRIKLRQEITVFQMLLANQTIPPVLSDNLVEIASSHNASIINTSSLMRHDVSGTSKRAISGRSNAESLVSVSDDLALDDDMSLPSVESDMESEAETLDMNVAKLHNVLNRRSMLGEMLDYESDSQLSLGISETLSSIQIGPLGSQYGTVRRNPKSETGSRYSMDNFANAPNLLTNTSSKYSSDDLEAAALNMVELVTPITPGIPRSQGYNLGLNLAVD